MEAALTDWEPDDLHRLASLFERLVSDFVTHAEAAVEGA